MLWIKAFHIIAIVIWFGGLLYLPRLFIYHAMQNNEEMNKRFSIMEYRLYFYVTTPGAILTLFFGIILLYFNAGNSLHALWMTLKLFLVGFLLFFHLYLGIWVQRFSKQFRGNSQLVFFFRLINELPFLVLIGIVLLVIIKPFGSIMFHL